MTWLEGARSVDNRCNGKLVGAGMAATPDRLQNAHTQTHHRTSYDLPSSTMSQPQIICVLGMHRTGSSCLTGSLQAAGLHLGKHTIRNKYNLRGNRENRDFVNFHEDRLAANKASWDNPPRKLRYSTSDLEQARELVAGFGDKRWGFKDPRTILALAVWNQVIPNAQYVGIFRHPLAVLDSLQQRDASITRKTCLQLWLHYNRLLYCEFRRRPFPLLCFDWDKQTFHEKLNKVIAGLGLNPLAPDQRFYSNELHNFPSDQNPALPWRLHRLYSKSRRACNQRPVGVFT